LRERDAVRRTFEGEWFLKVTRMNIAHGHSAGFLCVTRHPNLDFCATCRSLVTTRCKILCLFSCFCFVFYFCHVGLSFFSQDEMENVFQNSENFPEYYLTVYEASSYQTAVVFCSSSFLQNVRCTATRMVKQ
jgi:hypothetical protein